MYEDLNPFAVFSPTYGTRKDVPSILLSKVFTPDNDKVVLIDGEIHRRKMRDYYFKNAGTPVQSPDTYPVLLAVNYIKESTDTQYFLIFTKAHIYHWNSSSEQFDLKWTNHNISVATIAFNDNGAAADTITDAGNGFLDAGFVAGDRITVTGDSENNGDYTIDTVVAGTITLISTDELTTEIAGDDVVIVANCDNWETVNYNDKVIATNNIDYVLVWNAIGNFAPLDYKYGIVAGYTGTLSTVDADSASGQKILSVAATADYTAGDVVIINKDGAKEEEGKIDTIQAGISITLLDNLTYTHTGADADEVEICSVCTKAKYVTEYERFLILGFPYIDSAWCPLGLLSSAYGDENNFVSSNSGYYQAGEGGKVTGFGELQGVKYVFKQNSRVQMWLTPTADVFNFRELKDSFGTKASHSIVNDDKGNLYYLATDGTIKKEGTGTISKAIQTEILDTVNASKLYLIRSAFIDDYKELMWAIPLDGSGQNNCVVIYKDGLWLLIKDVCISDFGVYYA